MTKILKIQGILKDIFQWIEAVQYNKSKQKWSVKNLRITWYNDKAHKGSVATPRGI